MSGTRDVVRIAMPCTGLGRQRRGFEAFTREVSLALREADGLDLRVYGGGGDLADGERAVWNLPRTSRAGRTAAKVAGFGPYFVEQATFFAGFLPHLLSWRPHLLYFADLNFGNACWHWRRLTGQRFRMLYYNGGPTTRPFTRCDFVQQVTPGHFDTATARGEPAERMFVLPHGFTLPPLPAPRNDRVVAQTRAVLGVRAGQRLVLSVGMLGPTLKRMDVLVNAVASMGSDRPHLVMLGQETPETPALAAHARALLGDGVRMATWPRERMADAYAAADTFALLSLSEGFGLAYVEAMAAGLPCVAHDNPDTRYIFGDHAYLGDTTSLRSTTELLRLALKEEPSDQRRRGRHFWAREHFSWDVLAPRYREMLLACAAGVRPPWGAR
jgi:glycosyltransferase involved in cell wall biosynthesis